MAAKKVSRTRRVAGRIRRHLKAKPSIAIIAGLAIPPASAAAGFGRYTAPPTSLTEFWDRLNFLYTGTPAGSPINVTEIIKSDAVKLAAIGFGAHYVANLVGANRYLSRMKFPVRI